MSLIDITCLFCVLCILRALTFSPWKGSQDLLTRARHREVTQQDSTLQKPHRNFLEILNHCSVIPVNWLTTPQVPALHCPFAVTRPFSDVWEGGTYLAGCMAPQKNGVLESHWKEASLCEASPTMNSF